MLNHNLTKSNQHFFSKGLRSRAAVRAEKGSFDPLGLAADSEQINDLDFESLDASSLPFFQVAAAATALSALPSGALAKGGEYGIFEGRIVSLAHPVCATSENHDVLILTILVAWCFIR